MVGGFFLFRRGLWPDREGRCQAAPKTDGADKA